MSRSPFPSPSQSDAPPLSRAAELLTHFCDPDSRLLSDLAQRYGDEPAVLEERAHAVVKALRRFLEAFGDQPCAVYRAPARISLNPHCDHQGAWVPYGLHVRELVAAVGYTSDDRVEVVNTDASFAERLGFTVGEEAARSPRWLSGWLPYVEAPDVVQEVRSNLDAKTQRSDRRATLNYIRAGVLRIRHQFPSAPLPGLRMALNGNITQGGGQSSSSALVVSAALALADAAGLEAPRSLLAEWCGEAEWYVGTRGGSGDHAAMLLGKRAGLTHLCFEAPVAVRGVRYSPFPAAYQLIMANSQTRSEKSAEERRLFNRGIFAYRFAFLALKEAMKSLALPAALIEETHCLGDLHTGRLDEADLYRLLLQLPEVVSPGELAARFPATFSAAARGCFGTEDPTELPGEIPLRGAAVFGLGRVDRGRAMPDLLEGADEDTMREFGRLMSVTHDGDRLFRHGQSYTANRERLSGETFCVALQGVLAGESRPLGGLSNVLPWVVAERCPFTKVGPSVHADRCNTAYCLSFSPSFSLSTVSLRTCPARSPASVVDTNRMIAHTSERAGLTNLN